MAYGLWLMAETIDHMPSAIEPSAISHDDQLRLRYRDFLSRQRGRMDWTAARVRRLLEAIADGQQSRFAEREAEERQPDRQVVAGEPGRDDEIGKAGEVGDIGCGPWIRGPHRSAWRRRRGDETGPARRGR